MKKIEENTQTIVNNKKEKKQKNKKTKNYKNKTAERKNQIVKYIDIKNIITEKEKNIFIIILKSRM